MAIAGVYTLFFAIETLRPRTILDDLPIPEAGIQLGNVELTHKEQDGVPWLVHAVAGEGGEVRLESWPFIARGGESTQVVIFHADGFDAEAARKLQADLAERAVPFDPDFDHADARALYCTELITHVHARAGNPDLEVGVRGRWAIFPGDLAASPHLREVARSTSPSNP